MRSRWRSLGGPPRATRLKVGIVLFANADSPLAQLRDADLTGRDDASAGRFADRVEAAPILEGEDALRFSGEFFATLSPFGFAKRHGYSTDERRAGAAGLTRLAQKLDELSCWGDFRRWPPNPVAVEQLQVFIKPLATPPLPTEALSFSVRRPPRGQRLNTPVPYRREIPGCSDTVLLQLILLSSAVDNT